MKLTKEGLNLIKNFEGCKLKAYLCPAGVLTIGYGHTGPDVVKNMNISQSVADELLEKDLQRFVRAVSVMLKVTLSDNEFSALVSLCYNIGEGNLSKSTLLKLVNQGKIKEASEQFVKWNKAGGKVLKGLTTRRIAEANLFKGDTV